jgi:hypothetical protein
MSRMPLFMYHIVLCTSCSADFNIGHPYAYTSRSHGAEDENSSKASPLDVRMSTNVKLQGF